MVRPDRKTHAIARLPAGRAHLSDEKPTSSICKADGIPPEWPLAPVDCQEAQLLDQVVDRIVLLRTRVHLQFALDVGAIVVERLFNGNIASLRERGPKEQSLRRLAAHPRLPFSATTLWRCIAAYEVVRTCPEVIRLDGLSMAHIVAVRSLPQHQRGLVLAEASTKRKPAEWIRRRVASENAPSKKQTPRDSALSTRVHRIADAARSCEVLSAESDGIGLSDRQELIADAAFLRMWSAELAAWAEQIPDSTPPLDDGALGR